MKRFFVIVLLVTAAGFSVSAQKKNTPEEKTIVNKEYDENGNLTRFDSTYVWQWNSDSTFTFSPDGNFTFENGFPEMFGSFFNDSVFGRFGFPREHAFSPFNNDEFFRHFQHSFPDSMFFGEFPFGADSMYNFQFGNQFPGSFDFRELEGLQKMIEEQFKNHSFALPELSSPEQKDEWEKLIQKQQKEKEEFLKKWESQQP